MLLLEVIIVLRTVAVITITITTIGRSYCIARPVNVDTPFLEGSPVRQNQHHRTTTTTTTTTIITILRFNAQYANSKSSKSPAAMAMRAMDTTSVPSVSPMLPQNTVTMDLAIFVASAAPIPIAPCLAVPLVVELRCFPVPFAALEILIDRAAV